MYWRRRVLGTLAQQAEFTLPAGFNCTDTPGSWVQLKSRLFGAGVGSDNAMIDEHFRFSRLGLQAPAQIPTLTAAAGPGTSGTCRVAVAFYDRALDEWSPLSDFSDEVELADQARTTGNIPTTSNDYRVTDVGIFVVMNGGAPRLATMRQLGVTTVTESVATLALGAAFPTTFTRMARCVGFQGYHDRLVGFGDVLNPDIVYVSPIGRPERYEGLSFRTRNGEAVTAAISVRDVCLIMTANNAYVLRGYRDSDMTLTLLDAGEGCLSQQTWAILPGGNAIGINHNRWWLYNGAFHSISDEREGAWRDLFIDNRAQVEASHMGIDPIRGTLSLFVNARQGALTVPTEIPNPSNITLGTIAWTFKYADVVPELNGGMRQPNWFVDAMGRVLTASGLLSIPGTKRYDAYFGFTDGLVRGPDDTNSNDDADTFDKLWWIRHGANSFGDPGGFNMDGKTVTQFWSYLESEYSAWILYLKAGDEDAWRSLAPDNVTYFWKDDVAASLLQISQSTGSGVFQTTYTAKSLHSHLPQKVSGRCLTVEYRAAHPLGIRLRGFGGVYGPGPNSRSVVVRTQTK